MEDLVLYGGFDENGNVKTVVCKKHQWDDLPMKGLGKDFSSVGVNEPVIIPRSVGAEGVIWGYTKAEIERRANELNADTQWMELPSDPPKIKVWFAEKSK